MPSTTYVFIYGSLKPGQPNHHIYLDTDSFGKSSLLGTGTTIDKWPLVIADRYNTPYLLYAKGSGKVSWQKDILKANSHI